MCAILANIMKTIFFSFLLLFSALPLWAQTNSILITGGTVIDGSGAKSKRSDIRIAGGMITEIGNLKPLPNETVIDAKNKIVAPGFIDIHNHSETGLEKQPTANSQILQGITTLAVGPDGGSPWPIGEYLARRSEQGTRGECVGICRSRDGARK